MKVVLLAGGLGTRLSEETETKPKPMVEIGGIPMLCHIANIYAHYGYNEFVIALGYKGEMIKRYFLDYNAMKSDLTIHLSDGGYTVSNPRTESWILHLLDTGLNTQTGGRLKRLEPLLKNEPFMLTYGDGVASINVQALHDYHNSMGKIVTLTAVHPTSRFGEVVVNDGIISSFYEKPQVSNSWINGGFMVLEPSIFQRISGDETVLERDVLQQIAKEGQLAAYKHEGFWQCMDTLRDVRYLEELWKSGNCPWRSNG